MLWSIILRVRGLITELKSQFGYSTDRESHDLLKIAVCTSDNSPEKLLVARQECQAGCHMGGSVVSSILRTVVELEFKR